MQTLTMFLLFTMFGWLMLFVGLRTDRENRKKEENETSLTTGKIVRYEEKHEIRRGRKTVTYFPVIEYTVNGRVYTERSDYAENPQDKPEGTIMDVYFDSNYPENFHLGQGDQFRRGGRFMIRIGLFWIAAVLVFFLLLGIMTGSFSSSTPRFMQRMEWEVTNFIDGIRNRISPTAVPTAVPTAKPEKTAAPDPKEPEDKVPEYMAVPGEFEYSIKDGTAILERFTEINKKRHALLVIPDSIDGHAVTGMMESTFSDAVGYRAVAVPGTIREIPDRCFAKWPFLKTAELRTGVEKIGSESFARNRLLANVYLPDTITEIAEDAFPDDCKAKFHVTKGSYAEQYCREKGFSCEIRTEPETEQTPE